MPTSKENLRINGFVADLILLVFKNSRFLSLRPSFLFLFFFNVFLWYFQRFPGSSAGKESTCNAGDPSLIPGWGRCPGEGIGYPLQYSWAFLVAQTVKNLPTMQETWVWFLGWEDPLEEDMATHSSILAWRIPMDGGACWATVHGVTKSQTWLNN